MTRSSAPVNAIPDPVEFKREPDAATPAERAGIDVARPQVGVEDLP
jgi:hypothetical protein